MSRNAKFLLTYKKWPLGIDPGGHPFVFLNISINKKLVFVSQVVTNKNGNPRTIYHVAVQHFVGHCCIRLVALGVHEDP